MAITRSAAETYVLASLGKASGTTTLTAAQLVDLAGQSLYMLREWNWRKRGPVSFDLTADQNYITLRDDVSTITSFSIRNDTHIGFQFTDYDTISQYRLQSTRASSGFLGAVTYTIDPVEDTVTSGSYGTLSYLSTNSTITRLNGSWETDGFSVGTRFLVSDPDTGANDGVDLFVQAVTSATVIVVGGDAITTQASENNHTLTFKRADRPRPRIELYPTPAATETDVGQYWYRARWISEGGSSENLPIPDWIEPLFYAVLDEVSRGALEPGQMSLTERFDRIKGSLMYRSACATDSSIQPNHGPVQNGMATMGRAGDPYQYPSSASGVP